MAGLKRMTTGSATKCLILSRHTGRITLETDSFKYRGVIIDHKLNWTQHTAYVKIKISKGIGIMYRARSCLTRGV